LQDLEVVVKVQRLLAADGDPLVLSDLTLSVDDGDSSGAEPDRTRRPISFAGTE
jgi:hypothetical protein